MVESPYMSEHPPRPPRPAIELDVSDIEDYKDNEALYRLLRRLPSELLPLHLARIAHLSDENAYDYLHALHERRDDALRESMVSDPELAPYFAKHERAIWNALETEVFSNEERSIGRGSTAKVQRFNLEEVGGEESPVPELAVKYVVSPNETTISAAAEHDLLLEVEQLERLEEAEYAALGPDARVRVPHPYFYYEKGKIQCYAMELIDGVNLELTMPDGSLKPPMNPTLKQDLQESFRDIDEETLFVELDQFFDTMHSLCLHGDVKPANMMVSRDGHVYVIDFGQPKLLTSVEERHYETLQDRKEAEKRVAREAVRTFLRSLYA